MSFRLLQIHDCSTGAATSLGCLTLTVNMICHVGTVSYLTWASLPKAVYKYEVPILSPVAKTAEREIIFHVCAGRGDRSRDCCL